MPKKYSPEAQDAFLLGRYQYWRNDVASQKQAIASYQRAIDLQPDYAERVRGAVDGAAQTSWARRTDPGAHDEIRKAAFKALELDPDLAEAHAAIGAVSIEDWQWERAEQAFRRAIELNPESQDTCHCYAGAPVDPRPSRRSGGTDAAVGQTSIPVIGVVRQSRRAPVRGETLPEARWRFGGRSTWNRRISRGPFSGNVYLATGRTDDAVRDFDRPPLRGDVGHGDALQRRDTGGKPLEILR